jgi:integrase
MPRQSSHVPAYRLHKPSGQARVIIKGEHVYLGKYGSTESREKYARLIAELAATGVPSTLPSEIAASPAPSSINELILAFWRHAQNHYVRHGRPTRELEGIREALRPLRALYGSTPAYQFGPKKLKVVRQQMVESGLSRGVINTRVGRIKRLFKWATAEELITPSVYHGLQAVAGLTFGRTEARETEPIRPVPDLHVAAVLPFVSPHVAAMVKVQRLTGMRPGEVVIMRPVDIDTSGEIWIYEPFDHKNRWRGHRKQIPLGPEAQRIIEPFLDRDPCAFLFAPHEAEEWRLSNRPPYHGRERKTAVYPSEVRRRQRLAEVRRQQRAKRRQGERYSTSSYRRAIEYGLYKAKRCGLVIPHWHPHQLRHNRGTEVRRKYGIEAAQLALGHARTNATEVYAEKNLERAKQIAKEMG